MSFRKKFSFSVPEGANVKLRIVVWCAVFLVCVFFSVLTLASADDTYREYEYVVCQEHGFAPYELAPGSVLEQRFTSMGQSTDEVTHLYLSILRDESAQGNLQVRLYQELTGDVLIELMAPFRDFPASADVRSAVQEAGDMNAMTDSERAGHEVVHEELKEEVMLGDGGWLVLKSGQTYRLEVRNLSQTDSIYLLGKPGVQSGELRIDGEQQPGFINLSWMRKSLYAPSVLLPLLVVLTDITVLLGLALVLFTNAKEHTLYLVLAVGFGIVTLFDLTPLYGFDMRFQFDSTYVVSNQMMGLGGAFMAPSQAEPDQMVLSYYRRACDDYSQYQFYHSDEVSANYTDMKAGLRYPFVSEESQALILAETDLGFLSDQLYMYLPQAVGFTVARLLGMGMVPMLQLARLIAYAVFAATMYFGIRRVPFGKRIFLIWALVPTVMVQTISISRDAMIICMSFYVISKVLQMAYAQTKPKLWDWGQVLLVSALLAPCKMIYLPVSCLSLLTAYRQYIQPAGERGRKLVLRFVLIVGGLLTVFVAANFGAIRAILFAETVSLYNTEAYSISWMLTEPFQTLAVFGNTIRQQLGEYLVNAVQLFNIDLGCSDGITLVIFILLALESFCVDSDYTLRTGERGYMLLVAVGVFLLTAVASFRWTPITSSVIEGLQGRYLTPALPLVCLACYNNRILRVDSDAGVIIKVCCCIFPAVSLMNMYLWSVAQ